MTDMNHIDLETHDPRPSSTTCARKLAERIQRACLYGRGHRGGERTEDFKGRTRVKPEPRDGGKAR